MANIVEFILRLKDMMSGGMRGAAATAQRSMGTTAAAITRVHPAAERAGRSLRNMGSDARRTANDLSSLETKSQKLLGSLGGLRRIAAGVGIAALAGTTISAGMNTQQQKASFEVMAGQQEGGKLFKDLTKYAQDSIFGNEVYQNAQTMKAFGIETAKVMPTLKMLGDVSMGNKERLGSLSLAYSQVMTTGRLMGQDLLQLVNAGFNPLKIISDKTGLSMADLKKKMESGAISAKAVEMAFQAVTGPGGQFYQMTDKIAKTDFGKLEALKGQLSGLAMQIGGYLAPVIGNLITNYAVPFLNWLQTAASWIQSNSGWLTPLAIGVLSFVATLKAVAIATSLWTKAQEILNMVLVANPVGLVIAAIVALIALIGYVIYKVDGWGNAWKNTVTGAQQLWKGFTDSIRLMFLSSMNIILNGIDKIKLAWFSTQQLWDEEGARANISKLNAAAKRRQDEINATTVSAGQNLAGSLVSFGKAAQSLSWNSNRTVADGVKDLKEKIGMGSGSGIGLDFKKELSAGGGNGKGLKSEGLTHNGPRVITVNFNKSFIDKLELNSMNVKEGVGEMEDMIREAVYRIFYSLNSQQ